MPQERLLSFCSGFWILAHCSFSRDSPIELLIAVFGEKDSISKFMSHYTETKQNGFHIACAHARGSYNVIRYLLSNTNDEELRKLLMAKDNAGNAPLRYTSKNYRLMMLEYVRSKDKQLLRDLVLDSNAHLIFDCLSSAMDLRKILEFCNDDMLSDRSLIVQLSFGVDWSNENDEIRRLIVDYHNAANADGVVVTPDVSQSVIGDFMTQSGPHHDVEQQSDSELDEAGGLMKSHSSNLMNYVDPFLDPFDFFRPIEDPETGNSSLALCLMADNRELFDALMAKLEVEIDLPNYLKEYTNFRGFTLLHMAALRTTKRNEYCKVLLKKCLTQQNKDKLLYARNIEGNNIMHLLSLYASHYTPDENRDLWNLILQNLGKKSVETRLMSLMFEYNEQDTSAMSLFVRNLSLFSDGFGLFKNLVMNSKLKATKYDIPVFARVVLITLEHIKSTTELMKIVRFTVNRFPRKLRAKLLKHSDRGTDYMTIFDVVANSTDSPISRRFMMLYFLPIIDDKNLFIKMDKGGM